MKRRGWAVLVLLALACALTWACCAGRDGIELTGDPAHEQSGDGDRTLTLLCMNVHDLYVASNNRARRMAAIGALVRELDPDLVAIQEAFIESDRNALLAEIRGSRLAQHVYYDFGAVGSGLWILSAHPVVATDMHQFASRGKWYKPWHGDWYAGKGVAHARVALPEPLGPLDLFDLHAHASYSDSEEYRAVRTLQMDETADFVARARTPGVPALVAGDFNCGPGDPEYARVVERLALERLLTFPTELDHVFALPDERASIELVESIEIEPMREHEGETIELSDHAFLLVRFRLGDHADAAVHDR